MNITNVTVSLGQTPQPELRAGDAARSTTPRTPAPPAQQGQAPSPQQVQQAMESINRSLKASNSTLEFSYDQGTKQTVVRIVDTESGDVIRQIPSEAMLAIAESIDKFQKGLLLRQEA